MKYALIALFSLFSLAGFAQTFKGFPVIDNRPLTVYSSLRDMIETEGTRAGYAPSVQSVITSGTVTTGTAAQNNIPGYIAYKVNNVGFQVGAVSIGRGYLILGGKVTANVGLLGSIYIATTSGTKRVYPSYGQDGFGIGMYGGEALIPGGGLINHSGIGLQTNFQQVTTPNSATSVPAIGSTASLTISGGGYYSAVEYTDDNNYTAPYVIEWIGDSKAAGVGPTEENNLVAFKTREYYLNLGYDVRLRNLSVSGSTAQQHEYSQKEGRYHLPAKASLGLIDLGTNNSTDVPDTVANIVSRIAVRWTKENPKGICVVHTLLPRNDGNETAMANISTSIVTKINALANPRIKVITTTRTAWTYTDTSYYNGDNLHPNDKGNATWYALLKTFFDANVPTLPYPY